MKRKTAPTPALLAVVIAASFSSHTTADILISQYVEGSSYNKAVEIANTGDEAVSLAGYQLAMSTNGNGQWGTKLDLSQVSIDANSVWVVAHARASAAIKKVADHTNSRITNFNGDDPIALIHNDKVVDVLGQMGKVKFGEDRTLIRKAKYRTPSPKYQEHQWTELDKDDISGLGSLDVPTPPPAFTCLVDGNEPEFTTIQQIQGEGGRSPLIPDGQYESNESVFVKGVVSAVSKSLTKGFYLQALESDNNPKTSDGLFVYTKSAPDLAPGDVVCVSGKVSDFYKRTQLKSDAKSFIKQASQQAPAATKLVVNEGESLHQALERHEGMLIELDAQSQLHVTRNFSFDYDAKRNNMVLSHKEPLMKPTQVFAAKTKQAIELAEQNRVNQVVIESDSKAKSGEIPYYPDFAKDENQDGSSENHIRLGSRVEGMQGVVDYSYGQYRILVTNQLNRTNFVDKALDVQGKVLFDVGRRDKPAITSTGLKVASFNVLNYFTSHSDIGGELNASCKDQADADKSKGCNRGAKSHDEFLIQQAKIVKALGAMDADIIGLMEVENNGFGDSGALHNLVDALNSTIDNADNKYQYIKVAAEDRFKGEYFGSDAIMVALIYRPVKVSPDGKAGVIETPEQHAPKGAAQRTKADGSSESSPQYDKYQRHALVQTFEVKGSRTPLTIAVNHWKSKGSGCLEDWVNFDENRDPADLQGKCNRFRVSAAKAVGDALNKMNGDVLIMGDLNAYGMEDPVLALTDYKPSKPGRKLITASYTTLGKDAEGNPKPYQQTGEELKRGYGYINLNTKFHGKETFSYTYGGELGNLDHALASRSLAKKVLQVTDWHINSAESNMFEYSSKYTGKMPKYNDMFSASDHDPVIIAIDYSKSLKAMKLPPQGKKLSISYYLPAVSEAGDTVTVRLTKKSAITGAWKTGATQSASVVLTHAHLTEGLADIEFSLNPEPGSYLMEQVLSDPLGVEKFSQQAEVSFEATDVPKESSSSGGSFGFGLLLSMLGLGWLRRR